MNPHKLKVQTLLKSPFDRTLFLDSDAYIQKNVEELFGFLDDYDFCIAKDCEVDWHKSWSLIAMRSEKYCNTGVFAYKANECVKTFINEWYNQLSKQEDNTIKAGNFADQHYFNKLLNEENLIAQQIKFHFIPNTLYNVRPWMADEMKKLDSYKDAKIIHIRNLPGTPVALRHKIRKIRSKLAIRKRIKSLYTSQS